MLSSEFAFLLPYFVSLLISTGVALYAWHHRNEKGAIYLAAGTLLQATMTLGFIFELTADSMRMKILWDNTQFFGMLFTPFFLLVFALEFTLEEPVSDRRSLAILSILPWIFAILAFTDSSHGWVREQIRLMPAEPFAALTYEFGIGFWVMVAYVYLLTIGVLGVLAHRAFRTSRVYRNQLITIIIGVTIPLLGALLTLTNVPLGPHRDITPFTFGLGNLIIAIGFFRYGLLDILPIARTAVIEGMSDAVVVLDESDRVIDLNRAAHRFIHNQTQKAMGQPANDVFPHWFDLIDLYKYVDQTQTEIELPGEGTFDFNVTSMRNRAGNYAGKVIVVRDVTTRHQVEQQLRQRTEELEAANERLQALTRVKDEFVANVSHELRTPITSLKLYLDLVKTNPKKYESYLATFNRETERLANMIEGLLTLSRLDQDHRDVTMKALDINQLVSDFITDRQILAEERQLTLTFSPEDSLPQVFGDADLISQVVSILVTNSLNYTHPGGEIQLRTFQDGKAQTPQIGLVVKDTGPGISDHEQKVLFDRFFRGAAGRRSQVPGTGLGLSIAQEIVALHGGRIEVESEGEEGKGSTFTVRLPTYQG